MYLHTFVSKLMGLLTFAIQKKRRIPWKEKWSCFVTHISYKVCGLTQTLVAASKESHQDFSLRKGRKEITKRSQKEERREVRQRSTVKVYRESP